MLAILRSVLLHLAELVNSDNECNNAIYVWSLLDRLVFDHAHTCFYFDCLVLGGAAQSSVLCCHQMTFWSMVKSEVENIMKTGLVE
jgi:hypothetical protein